MHQKTLAIILTSLNFVTLSICADSKLLKVLQFMHQTEDVFIISGFKDLKSTLTATSSQNTRSFSWIKAIPTNGSITNSFLPLLTTDATITKIIVEMETLDETIAFVNQFADPQNEFNVAKAYWTLVMWPEVVTTEFGEEKVGFLQEKFNQSSHVLQSCSVSSKLFFGFLRENSSIDSTKNNISSFKDHFIFYEMYAINGMLKIQLVNQLGAVLWGCDDSKCECNVESCRRMDFHGVNLKVEGVEDPEFQNDTHYKYDDKTNEIVLDDGFSVQILKLAQQALNFTYNVTIMNPEVARQLGEVSSWDGVINRVEKGEVDLGLSLTVFLPERQRRIFFLPSTDDYIVSAFFRPPSLNAIRDIFMQPFEADLWAAVVSSWLVLAFSMIMFTVIRKRIGAATSDEPDFSESSLIWALATACQQGWDEHPVAGSLRAIFISGSFTGVVAYAGYSAAIVSTLSLRSDPIKTPEDLIQSSLIIGMRYGFLDNILSHNETDDIITKIYHRLSKHPDEGRVNVSQGFSVLENKDYAFVCIRDTFYDTVNPLRDDKYICGIRDLQILKHGFPAGPFVPKTSVYKEFFRAIIIKIKERGVIWRLREYYAYTRRCMTSNDNSGLALGLNDVFTAFMILLGGYILSAVFVFVEKVLYVNKMTYIQ